MVGVIAGMAMGLMINLSLGQVGMDYSQFAGITEYMALISGKIYPTLGLSKIVGRAIIVLIIAARREPSEALHHV